MAWIELHQTLPRHPKLFRLAAKLRIPRAQAAGHLTFLWLWTLDYSPTGDLSAFGPAEISAAADFGGDADAFVAALRETGWVEEDGHIHDWMEFAGKLLASREKAAARGRDMRRAYESGQVDIVRERDGSECRYCGISVNWGDRKGSNGGTYDHVDPFGPSTSVNLVVSCRGCNSRKGQRTPDAAGLRLIPLDRIKSASNPHLTTVPYSTVPNQTLDASLSPRARESEAWPTQADVTLECEMRGIPTEVGEAFWNHFEASGWVDKNGNPIQQWRPKLTSWWRKEQEDRAKQNQAANGNASPRAATGSPRPPTVYELTKVLEAKESLAAGLRGRHCSDVAGGTSWDSEAKREEWRKLRAEIKELKERIAKAA